MRTDSELSGILIYENDSAGYITRCNSSGSFLTTASKFAVGCILVDTTTGKQYYNAGTIAVPSWKLTSDMQTVTIELTAAQIIAMYTTPVLVLAGVADKAIIVDAVNFDLTGTATHFTGGGVVGVQYDDTANGAGTLTHADIAASVVTGATALVKTSRIGLDLSAVATASIDGIGLYISNKTAVFATGTGTASVTVSYRIV